MKTPHDFRAAFFCLKVGRSNLSHGLSVWFSATNLANNIHEKFLVIRVIRDQYKLLPSCSSWPAACA